MRSAIRTAAAALALVAGAASAETWTLARGDSRIAFAYLENGLPIEGEFTRFDGRAEFAAPDLSDARVTVVVETASVSFGDPLRDHFARSVDWFDAENHPEARFELARLVPLPDGRHSAEGVLEIRGVRRDVDAVLEVRRSGDALSASGELAFPRSDFGVGIGFSALIADIGDVVTVRFLLVGDRVE